MDSDAVRVRLFLRQPRLELGETSRSSIGGDGPLGGVLSELQRKRCQTSKQDEKEVYKGKSEAHQAVEVEDLPAVIAMANRPAVDELPDEAADVRREGRHEASDVEQELDNVEAEDNVPEVGDETGWWIGRLGENRGLGSALCFAYE
jgi:hypothetical protein